MTSHDQVPDQTPAVLGQGQGAAPATTTRSTRTAHERGGLRWAGGAWSLGAVPAGPRARRLQPDQRALRRRASPATRSSPSQCMEATEKKGYARDLCSYMRNYWGSLLLDRYAFGGPFPKPDFIWQDHICCSHAKWYQVVTDIEPEIPYFCVDVSVGPYHELNAEPARLRRRPDARRHRVAGEGHRSHLRRRPADRGGARTSAARPRCGRRSARLNKAIPAPAGREDACTRSTCSAP